MKKQHAEIVAVLSCLLILISCGNTNDPLIGSAEDNQRDQRSLFTLRSFQDDASFINNLKTALIEQKASRFGEPGDPQVLGIPNVANGGNENSASASAAILQEPGVAEQDLIKTDGQYAYVIRHVYPDNVESVAGIKPALQFDVLTLEPAVPQARSIAQLPILDTGGFSSGMYLHQAAAGKYLTIETTSSAIQWQQWADSFSFVGETSSLQQIDITNATQPTNTQSLVIDGQIISSRRIGNRLYLVSRFYPEVAGLDPAQVTTADWGSAVQAADADSLLPGYTSSTTGRYSLVQDPSSCFIAQQADTGVPAADIVTLAVFDLDNLTLLDSECFLGNTETVYASSNAIYLATTRWAYTDTPSQNQNGVAVTMDGNTNDPRIDTHIHRFDITSSTAIDYIGSGSVDGHLGWNAVRKSSRLSEKDGYLTVATYTANLSGSRSPITVSVLQRDSTNKLATVGTLPDNDAPGFIGQQGERLSASRFIDQRLYLTSVSPQNPMFVIDLSNPVNPALVGNRNDDGYSEQLYPVDENYLLGVGYATQSSDGTTGDGRGAYQQGIKLFLYNIEQASAPAMVASTSIGQRGSSSAAVYDHRALTIQTANENHPHRIALAINVAGIENPPMATGGDAIDKVQPWNFSGLFGFEITTGANASITPTGSLIANSAQSSTATYQNTSVLDDRSVIVGDSVFYVHGTDVYSARWGEFSAASRTTQ